MTHHVMCLFGAGVNTYYPAPGKTAGTSYGASTNINDWVFGDGSGGVDTETRCVIRAILVPNVTTASSVLIYLKDGAGQNVMVWRPQQTLAQDLLCGPDGIELPQGFYIQVASNPGAYLVVVYDKE